MVKSFAKDVPRIVISPVVFIAIVVIVESVKLMLLVAFTVASYNIELITFASSTVAVSVCNVEFVIFNVPAVAFSVFVNVEFVILIDWFNRTFPYFVVFKTVVITGAFIVA